MSSRCRCNTSCTPRVSHSQASLPAGRPLLRLWSSCFCGLARLGARRAATRAAFRAQKGRLTAWKHSRKRGRLGPSGSCVGGSGRRGAGRERTGQAGLASGQAVSPPCNTVTASAPTCTSRVVIVAHCTSAVRRWGCSEEKPGTRRPCIADRVAPTCQLGGSGTSRAAAVPRLAAAAPNALRPAAPAGSARSAERRTGWRPRPATRCAAGGTGALQVE